VLLRLFESDDFRVVEQVVLVPALAHDLVGAVENHAAHGGVRRGDADAAACQFKGALHPVEIEIGELVEGGHVCEPQNNQVYIGRSRSGIRERHAFSTIAGATQSQGCRVNAAAI